MATKTFTVVIQKDEDMFVAECPELGTVSQGNTIEKAVENLKEATELYLEDFPSEEKTKPIVTFFEVNNAKFKESIRRKAT